MEKRNCEFCGSEFTVTWWSNRSRIETMKIRHCISCEMRLRPDGVVAQFVAAQSEEKTMSEPGSWRNARGVLSGE